ncbi:hypothetical protein Hanom_Chr08g00705781 [Helianthus anomalus]
MHHLCPRSRRHPSLSIGFAACQALVRFFAFHRIKPHALPLVRAPVNCRSGDQPIERHSSRSRSPFSSLSLLHL